MDNDIVVLKPSLFLLLIALCLSLSIVQPSSAQHSPPNVTVAGNPSPSPPPPNEKPKFSPFRPSMAVIVGVLTTMFSVTFLLLLYAKHCKRGGNFVLGAGAGVGDYNSNHPNSSSYAATAGRKNSGVDRGVVESLPVFRFGALSGHNKEGLECAVCLNRFESAEVLRLLPKCRHAFHVECVDTWLDAHSTCPLCRYRVDPEDILLLDTQPPPPPPPPPPPREEAASDIETGKHSLGFLGRLSGRHSSAGERVSQTADTASYRRSLDSWSWRKKKDSWRKDGLLLSRERDNSKAVGRFEHRIIVSPACGGPQQHQRWSDFQPSDLLYLRSEMIMGECRGLSSSVSGSRPSVSRQQLLMHSWRKDGKGQESGRGVINSRSVSEITGIERFSNDNNRGRNDTRQRQRQQAGLLSRWVAWVSQLRPAVGSEANNQPQIISP